MTNAKDQVNPTQIFLFLGVAAVLHCGEAVHISIHHVQTNERNVYMLKSQKSNKMLKNLEGLSWKEIRTHLTKYKCGVQEEYVRSLLITQNVKTT